jgi:uncharacterized protein involved in type VI secretion and phage assembly
MNRGGGPRAGEMQGVVMAKVVDNVDPEEYGRIKVKLVTTHNEAETFWAWQLAPMTGKERGFYTLPEKDDTVLVAFIQGSQDNAVILGALWNGKDIPPQEAKDALPGPDKTLVDGAAEATEKFTQGTQDLAGNDRRFWKSRSGHLFVFDDSNGAETVQIWDKTHTLSIAFDSTKKLITIANTEGDIEIRSKGNMVLEAMLDMHIRSAKNVTVYSGQNTDHTVQQSYTLTTQQENKLTSTGATTITGTQGATMKSDMTATVEGSVQTNVKGGMTSVSGTSMTEVKGGVVKIN